MSDTELRDPIETIAIVGMSGRFPGAAGIKEFWGNLENGKESVSFFTDEELLEAGVDPILLSNPNYVKAKAHLEYIDKFDAAFFGYSPREASLMDPQQRFFLECAWEALEDGGYNPETYQGPIGLFAGTSLNSYLILNLLSDPHLLYNDGILQTSIPNRTDHLTTRVAYKLNLKGPAVTVQTACSTSLVAVHLACQSLLNYQSDMALAGGVTIGVPNKSGYIYQEAGVLSPDGHCRAFDAKAEGTTVGNGVGVVVLKRLSDAIADRDQIYAVIKGSAVNNDGSNKVGFTAPGVEGQIEVISTALQLAGVEPKTVSYIETHGTGTSLGDPIEIQALSSVFREREDKTCAIGSVKTNIGHLDVAAGITGLIKTVLALKHKKIPPSLNFTEANPHIEFDQNCFYVNTELQDWVGDGGPRRAGVSSFGIGGTNAHVVLEEYPEVESTPSDRPSQLVLLSAQTQESLETATQNLSKFLKSNEDVNMADAAFTMQTGRKHFRYRRSFACSDREEAVRLLDNLDPKRVTTGLQEPKPRPVVFMFTGQGAQYAGMGSELYCYEKVFRETVDKCARHLQPKLNLDIRELLFAEEKEREAADKKLSQTYLTQPALFIIEYALAKVWESWNVIPQAMIGHSIGEYVAACLAGVFTLEDCLDLVALRGGLMQSAEPGSMLSVSLPETEVRRYLSEGLSLSAVNSPTLCVIGGPDEEIEKLRAKLMEDHVDCRLLETSHAFHSSMMEPILAPFRAALAGVKMSKPSIPFVSNVTGRWISDEEATSPDYWAGHLRNTVRFSEGVMNFFEAADTVLLEVGPGRTLMTIARWHPQKGVGQTVLTSLPHADERERDLEFLFGTAGRLWLLGLELDWDSFHQGDERRKISLPTYPFDKKSYWINPVKSSARAQEKDLLKKKENLEDWIYVPSWKRSATLRNYSSFHLRGRTILYFSAVHGAGERIGEKIEELGATVIKIIPGREFADLGDDCLAVNPESVEDFSQLLRTLSDRKISWSKIIYGWSLFDSNDTSALKLNENFFAPLYLIQKLGEHYSGKETEIVFLTDEMLPVTGNENVFPAKSLLLSFGKVAPMEYPNLKIRNLDFSAADLGSGFFETKMDTVIHEIFGDHKEAIVAYRNNYRWIQEFDPQPLPALRIENSRLRQNGVYLITGGLGGVGLTLAKYLARTVRASLVLVGRSTLPSREQWQEAVKLNGGDPMREKVARRIRDILEIEEIGGRVLPVNADVGDFDSMKEAVAQAIEEFGKIDGVIHCAGIPAGGMIHLKERSAAEAVLKPKVQGTLNLDRVFEGIELDFMAICSSRNAILGGFGQIDYCAANNFCDAFAHYYSKRHRRFAFSINWDAWQEVGMLAETAAHFGVNKTTSNGDRQNGLQPTNPAGSVHPLLGTVLEEGPDSVTFISEQNINNQWVLEEHRIGSNPVIPGVTYLEMARAAMAYIKGELPIRISEVYFITPLSMKDDESRFIKFRLEKKGKGYSFTALSTKENYSDPAAEWRDHVFGKVEVLAEEETPKHDLAEFIQRCSLKKLEAGDHELDPDLGPRWQNIKAAYLGQDEYLLNFELNPEFESDLNVYKLHPSLLDRAAGSGMLYLELDAVYLPFSYQSLTYRKPLTRSIYAFITQVEPYRKGMETVTFDVVICDEHGNELVAIKEFSEKRINDLSEKIKTIATEGATISSKAKPASNGNTFYEESLQEGISPLEGAEIFGRLLTHFDLPQAVVSTKDLNASIEKARHFTQEAVALEIDKIKTSHVLQPRPNISTAYLSPRNEIEKKLAAIMSELLGIEDIGVEDNFFELGGDSVLGIQIISKAKKQGLEITPQQVFQYQTIASLASVVTTAEAESEVEELTAEFEMVDFDSSELDSIAEMIGE